MKTTRLLSIRKVIDPLLGQSVLLIFLSFLVENCNLSDFLVSILIILKQLNVGIICFTIFDQLMRVKFLGSLVYSKTTNITLAIMISEPFLRFSFSNINIAISIPDFVFNIIRMFLIIVFNGITPNFARWIMVRCKKMICQ